MPDGPQIVLTGGTAGAQLHDGVARTAAGPPPGLDGLSVSQPLQQLSEELQPADWVLLADWVRALPAGPVIVVHGTDTMAWTAAALAFLLADRPAPIILTGAALPPEHPASDWQENLALALTASAQLPDGVWVAFAGQVHQGTRTHKHAGPQLFESVGVAPAAVLEHGVLQLRAALPAPQPPPRPVRRLRERVVGVRLHPGLELCPLVRQRGLLGLAVELYPSGSCSSETVRCLQAAWRSGLTVACSVPGRLPDCVYPSAERLRAGGIPILEDLPLHTLTVKLMWALGGAWERAEALQLLELPVAGEQVIGAD